MTDLFWLLAVWFAIGVAVGLGLGYWLARNDDDAVDEFASFRRSLGDVVGRRR